MVFFCFFFSLLGFSKLGLSQSQHTNAPFICYFCCCRELLTYTDGTIPLAETDLDIIAKSKPENFDKENEVNGNDERHNHSTKRSKRDGNNNGVELQTDDKEVDGERETEVQADFTCGTNSQEPQKALKLSFTLPASCYATMAIRELLKTSTSVCAYLSYNSNREI